jgi:hypothetical protein
MYTGGVEIQSPNGGWPAGFGAGGRWESGTKRFGIAGSRMELN